MKNYVSEAKKINVNIYNDTDYLKSYRINHDAKYVEMRYMNGYTQIKDLDEITKEELDNRQRSDLGLLQEKIKEKTSFEIKYNGAISGIYTGTGITLLALGNAGGIVWLTWVGFFLTKALRPLKLRKDIELAGWIYDNREEVNKVIVEEVRKKMPNSEITATTINAPEIEYPYDAVPYSKTMYEQGINLNNIDELSNRELRKLKRKVKNKNRGK